MVQSLTKKQQQMEWRRQKVQELSVKGFGIREIARTLDIPKSTIENDMKYLRQEAKETIRNHIQEKLPYEYKKCIMGLENIIKECYNIAENCTNNKDKLQSLSLISEVYDKKMNLLTNGSLLQDSIKFVEQNKKDKMHHGANVAPSNGAQDLDNDIQGSTEDNTAEQYNTVY